MRDAFEWYESIRYEIEGDGVTISDEADDLIDKLARQLVADNPLDLTETRGAVEWECYNREGNEAMEAAFQDLVAGLRSGEIKRLQLPDAINDAMHKIGNGRETGHWDTEPQTLLAARLNPVLDELGYKAIERWDW